MSSDTHTRQDYRWFQAIDTRWMDNDVYGHVNNVIYYSWFDTVANNFLITEGGIDIHIGDRIGYIVHSQCSYKSAIAYPEPVTAGLRVNRLGNSSVEYGIGIFKDQVDAAAAYGTFTHVFVNRATERPAAIEGKLRQALESVLV